MTQKKALLFVKLAPPIERESEWNNWYNDRHVSDRLAIPGFLSARRFTKIDGIPKEYAVAGEAKYLALYDLASVQVLKDEPYRRLREKDAAQPKDSFEELISKLPKFARGVYEQIYPEQGEYTVPPARFVFVVGHEVPRNRHQEFNAWYNNEHLPSLLAVPGFLTGRRFILAGRKIPPIVDRGGSLSKYLTVYDIENESTFESDAFRKAALSPWSDWVRSWHTLKMCTLYNRIYAKE